MNWQCCPRENVKKDTEFIEEEVSRKAEELFPLAAGCSQPVVDEVSINMAFKGGFGIYFRLKDFRVLFSLQYSLFDISVECNENSDCSGKSPTTKCDENANRCGKFLSNQSCKLK